MVYPNPAKSEAKLDTLFRQPQPGCGMCFFESFMTDQRIELSNILIENVIRPVAIGRKNYMNVSMWPRSTPL
jgi:hypothetical protein